MPKTSKRKMSLRKSRNSRRVIKSNRKRKSLRKSIGGGTNATNLIQVHLQKLKKDLDLKEKEEMTHRNFWGIGKRSKHSETTEEKQIGKYDYGRGPEMIHRLDEIDTNCDENPNCVYYGMERGRLDAELEKLKEEGYSPQSFDIKRIQRLQEKEKTMYTDLLKIIEESMAIREEIKMLESRGPITVQTQSFL